MNAVILAGSPNTGKLRECSPANNEALIDIGGRYMVEYVVEALKQIPEIDRIVVVGAAVELDPLYSDDPKIKLTGSGSTPIESLRMGISKADWHEDNSRVLIVTSDVPMITAEALQDFLACCQDRSADLYYPVVSQQVSESKFPGVTRTYVRLKEGTFTGGNIFLVNAEIIERVAAQAEEFVRLRKKPLAMASLIGYHYVFKYLMKKFSIKDAERRISELLHIRGICIISDYAELGIDVDKPCDLELARQVLAG